MSARLSILAIVFAAGISGCQIAIPPEEAAVPLAPRIAAHGKPEDVLVFAGHPSRPYEVRALVAACGIFHSPLSLVRKQADGAGADAIIELTTYATSEGACASGVAVRLQ